eukprot:1909873-Ditylum_brightwellii.AAC.1
MGLSCLCKYQSMWPPTDCDKTNTKHLDNPPKAKYWHTVETHTNIAFYLKLRNHLHFGQVHGTPLTVPPLSKEFDWAANSCHSELVPEENYSNSELAFLQTKLLEHCKKESVKELIGDEITIDQFKDKIQMWTKSTTTSSSGKHLGHYNALINRGAYSLDSIEGIRLKEKQQQLLHIHIDMLNYAVQHR